MGIGECSQEAMADMTVSDARQSCCCGWFETFVGSGPRPSWDGAMRRLCPCGWFEILLRRLVDRTETLRVRSDGRVAGFGDVRGCLAKFGVARSRFVVLTQRSVTFIVVGRSSLRHAFQSLP